MIVPFFISHRGCGHRCVFCDQSRISGQEGLIPSGEEILARLAEYSAGAHGGEVEIAFFGGSFTALPRTVQEQLLAPLQPPLSRGEINGIRVSTRPDAVDPGTAAFLRAHGVVTVELGVQSMDDRVLALSGRGHTSEHVVTAFASLRAAGLRIGAQLMPGLPGDTAVISLRSLSRLLALRPDFLRIYPTLVISGTELAALYGAGSYAPLTLDAAVNLGKLMLHNCLKESVPVIRMGLHPSEELLEKGAIVAGPFHPAYRQLVESELYFDLMELLTRELPSGYRFSVVCAAGRTSDVAGHRRANLKRLAARGLIVESIHESRELPPYRLELRGAAFSCPGDVVNNLSYPAEEDIIV